MFYFLANCLAVLKQESIAIVSKNMLQFENATCSGFKKPLQSWRKTEPSSTADVTRCNFLCNLCYNGVARQVAGGLQHVTCSLCYLSGNFWGLQQLEKVELGFTFLQRLYGLFCSSRLQRVTCLLQLAIDYETSCKKNCIL